MDDVIKGDDLLQEIRDRFKEAYDAVDSSYSDMVDDLNFANGDQWPSDLKAEREADGRPCLTINKVANHADQIKGDIRQNEPSIKVKPVDSGSDPDTAEIITGLIRNIEVQSNAEVAYDTAAESAVDCGKGTFRVVTEYADDDTFDQDIRIKRMKNPFTVFWDPSAQEWDKSDARYCFVTERISREEYGRLYPEAAVTEFPGGKDTDPLWAEDRTVRIAEYFVKRPEKKTLLLLKDPFSDQTIVSDEEREGFEVVKKREVESTRLEWYKTNGVDILEGPTDWPGKLIPICEVWGKELNIEGKSIYRGMIRNSKDPQRLYNYSRSSGAEVTSLAPKVPYIVSAKMVNNYQDIWKNAHKKNYPYLPFEADPMLQGMMPQRAAPISQSSAITQEIMIADQEIHDTTGLQQASLGQKSNEKSGKAIIARQREGDVANYAYYDNLGRAMTYCGKVLLDLIPKIYDTARILRIIEEDGSDQFVPVNQPVQVKQKNGKAISKIFDLTTGKYDVVVTIGPSYSSQREEASEGMMNFLERVPDAGPLIADLVVKNQDWPGAQEISERLKTLLPPGVAGGGAVQPPAAPPPDPMQALDAEGKQAETESKKLDNVKKRFEIMMQAGGQQPQ